MIEYMLAIIMCIGLASLMSHQINKGIGKIWKMMAKDIAPGCPGCTPPDDLN